MDLDVFRKANDMKNAWSNKLWNNEVVPFVNKLVEIVGASSAGSVTACAIEDVLARMMTSMAQIAHDRSFTEKEYEQFFDEAHETLRNCVRDFMTKKIPGLAITNVKLDDPDGKGG